MKQGRQSPRVGTGWLEETPDQTPASGDYLDKRTFTISAIFCSNAPLVEQTL